MSSGQTVYLLDAYSQIFQVFHAIPAMNGPAGQPTNAVFGIFRDLLGLVARKPDYLIAVFDGPERVFRSDMYEAYKANRAEMPQDLQVQIPVVKQLYESFGVPVVEKAGYEADDLIATLATIASARDLDVYICTSDKDARQLLDNRVKILNLRKNQVFDAATLESEWGISPSQVVDLLALTGDAVDNVPGVPGIGIKTAADLLKSFGTLDAILDRVGEVSGKKRQENLRAHADTARLARRLVALECNVPIELDWERLAYRGYDARALKELCIASGFHRFLDEIAHETRKSEVDWSYDGYELINTPEAFAGFLERLRAQPRFAFDTETTALEPLRAELVGLSFAWEPGHAFYIAVRAPLGQKTLDTATVLEALRPILADPAREIVGQNLKYDLLVLARHGLEVLAPITDTMVLSYLLESGERNHNLDELSRRLLDHTMIPMSSLIGKGKTQLRMDQVDTADVCRYAAEDADAAWRLEAVLTPRVREEGLWNLYADLERPLIGVLASMERTGIAVDVPRLRQLARDFESRLEVLKIQVHEAAGGPFAIGSGPQLRQILFEQLRLPVVKRTPKGEPSTDAEVLEQLAPLHPLPRLIVQHRQLEKLKSTYLDTLPGLVHDDGRIHASFNQVVAATGRLSSSDPNLQNIPVRTEDGRQIRQAFVPGEKGWSIVSADYSQIELRILAHFSEDSRLLEAFAESRDIHAVVAAEIFGVPLEAVTPEQRRVAKTVNFGVIYGLSGFGLAARLGISRAEGDAYIQKYFEEYEGVTRFIRETLVQARDRGRVETILGRRRTTSGIKNVERMATQAERIAVNAVIQGSAADLIKRAMVDIDRGLRSQGLRGRMLLQIHDELVFETPDEELEGLAAFVREAMTSAIPFRVPIEVEVAAGPNWLDVAELPAS